MGIFLIADNEARCIATAIETAAVVLSTRDLLYIRFGVPGEKAARTETVTPGVHADFDRQGRLVGIEVLDAAEVLRHKVQFEVTLVPAPVESTNPSSHWGGSQGKR